MIGDNHSAWIICQHFSCPFSSAGQAKKAETGNGVMRGARNRRLPRLLRDSGYALMPREDVCIVEKCAEIIETTCSERGTVELPHEK